MDMTNLDGMDTLLYPAFVEFASGRRLAWAVSDAARRHNESLGLARPQLFERVEDASGWVAGGTG